MTLAQIVSAEIITQAQTVTLNEAAIVNKLKQKAADYGRQHIDNIRQEVRKLRCRIQELENLTAKLYEDKYSGAISKNTFLVLIQKNEKERISKSNRLAALLTETEKTEKETAIIQNWTTIIRKYQDLQKLDWDVVNELIDHIEIGEKTVIDGERRQNIKIFYRFIGLIESE